MNIESISTPHICGFLHPPQGTPRDGIVLTHGAGSNCRSALLVGLAASLAELGWAVLRCDLPFRVKRASGPPHPSHAAADRAGLLSAVREMGSKFPGRVYLGGHSYGGRQASILASENPGEVPGLLLLSYPLHPPDKPEQLRTGHFGQIRSRCLFAHGTSDPFGSPEELESAIALIPAETRLLTFTGLGHELGKGKLDIIRTITREFQLFVGA